MRERFDEMSRYDGLVTEILQRKVAIEAESEADADRVLRDMYQREEIVLSSEDYVTTAFRVRKERK
ncbi:MAG: DpnD/PcfM family protein [Oscillospiraceae bacterium]|nr:DpnD/PcfM family protein [Oscillospiraceae bacterium]